MTLLDSLRANLHHSVITDEKVQKIHGAGMEAGAWTVNDEATLRRLLELQIDRIYTDFPRRLLRVKRTRRPRIEAEKGKNIAPTNPPS